MKISVITTTYNQKEYLYETIESIQKSILSPLENVTWEHMIYDDGSTDDTESIFEKQKWPNVSYWKSTENNGPSYGRNRLIEKASGEYIFMIDGDDIALQRTLHNFAQVAIKNPKTPWFVGDFLHVDAELRYLPGKDYFGWDFKNEQEMLEAIFKGEHFIQSNVFFKKEIFTEVGGFDESMKMTEDLDLFIRFLRKGHLPLYTPHITHLHRIHNNNLSKEVSSEVHKKHMQELIKKYA